MQFAVTTTWEMGFPSGFGAGQVGPKGDEQVKADTDSPIYG
jgi:hypothetical protein